MKNVLFLILFSFTFSCLSSTWTYGILGDAGSKTRHSQEAKKSLLKDKIHSLILPGDNLYDLSMSYADVWNEWFEAGFKFPLVAIGNHFKTYAEEVSYFSMPGEFYAKAEGKIRFIVLNSDNMKTIEAQKIFFLKEISEAREAFIFIIFHHPPFTIKHGWKEREAFHLAIRPLLTKYQDKITALIVGHDHIASLIDMGGLPVIVSGAAFESFKIPPVNTVLNGKKIKTVWSSSGGFFWTRLDIDDQKNHVWLNFVRTDKEAVDCSVRIKPKPYLLRSNCKATYNKPRRGIRKLVKEH